MGEQLDKLWGLHAGAKGEAERLFLTYGYIGMSWARMGDILAYPTEWEAFKKAYLAVYPEDEHEPGHAINAGQIHRFVHEMKIGDYVAFRPHLSDHGSSLVFLGRVTGPYLYNPFLVPKYPNLRRVEWLRSLPVAHFSEPARRELGAFLSVFQIDTHAAEFLTALAEAK